MSWMTCTRRLGLKNVLVLDEDPPADVVHLVEPVLHLAAVLHPLFSRLFRQLFCKIQKLCLDCAVKLTTLNEVWKQTTVWLRYQCSKGVSVRTYQRVPIYQNGVPLLR